MDLDVPVVDLLSELATRDAAKLFLDQAHFTPEGNAVVAHALWPAIVSALEQ